MTNIAIRWSGLLLIVGAALLGTAIVMASLAPDMTQIPRPANALLFLAAILLLLSLPAMYARQADAAGWLGLTGHVLLQTGVLLFPVVSAPALLYSSFATPKRVRALFASGWMSRQAIYVWKFRMTGRDCSRNGGQASA